MENETILKVRSIKKIFPGVKALDDVSFELKKGEVHALVGENGAGKSTLMHILGGIIKPNEGEIFIEGNEVGFENPHDANKKGISVVFQELSLVKNLSVAENIFSNRQPVNSLGMVNWEKLYSDTRELLKSFDENSIDPKTLVKDLSVAKQQVIEILKAMSFNPKVLILDEPTSSLTQMETQKLFENIKKMKQQGIACIYISHHINEIFEIADRVTVLRDGKYVATKAVGELDENKVVTLMVGREVRNEFGETAYTAGERDILFETKKLTKKQMFKDISFSLRKGEIIGFAGLVGAGRTEMAKAIFGVYQNDSGEIYLEGKKIHIRNTSDAINKGIAYISEDRKQEGLLLDMDIKANCIAPSLKKFQTNFLDFLDEKKILSFANECKEKYRIATPTVHRNVRNLSGGNQQKVLLSSWIGISPKVLIVDEPTKGVDVGARSEIYLHLRKLAATGIGIVVISSDLMEILGISDRIYVMREGEIVAELNKGEATEKSVIAYATGAQKNGCA